MVQPDGRVVCDPAMSDRHRLRSGPQRAMAVPSPRTAGHDHLLEAVDYARTGVREYWLMHPTDRLLTR